MTDTPQQPASWMPGATQRSPKGRRTLLIGFLAALTVVVLGAGLVAVMLLRSRSFTLSGSVVLSDGYEATRTCRGNEALSDIAGGAPITVTDAAGATIALGQLATGQLPGNGTCVFDFRIDDVPAGKDFYGVEISRRGIIRYSEAEIKAGVKLALGP